MNSQHQIILGILSDLSWHCTSEMRSEYMADPPKRLQELRDDKHYLFYEPRLCKRHNHKGGVKEWRLIQLEPSETPNLPRSEEQTLPTGKTFNSAKFIKEVERIRKILLKNDPHRFDEPQYGRSLSLQCCEMYEKTKSWHTRACETQKEKV